MPPILPEIDQYTSLCTNPIACNLFIRNPSTRVSTPECNFTDFFTAQVDNIHKCQVTCVTLSASRP